MGLQLAKEIGGVPLNYHRVASVNIITNQCNLIEVQSYVSKAKRDEEKAALENRTAMDVFIHATTYQAPYDQTMTVDSAYAHIKALADFEGAVDVLED